MNFYKGFLFEDTSNLRQNKIGLYNIVINLEKRVYYEIIKILSLKDTDYQHDVSLFYNIHKK